MRIPLEVYCFLLGGVVLLLLAAWIWARMSAKRNPVVRSYDPKEEKQ